MTQTPARRLISRALTSLAAIAAVSVIFAAKAMDAEARLAAETAQAEQHAALR